MAGQSASTYNFIASQTLTTTSTNVTFNNLPQNYTDLVIVLGLTGTTGGNSAAVFYNGDSNASNYSFLTTYGDGSNKGSVAYANSATQLSLVDTNYAHTIASVMNYSSTNVYKTYVSEAYMPDNQLRILTGTWRNTNAITSVTFFPNPNAYSFAAGSTFTLYGIKAADVASIIPTKAIGGDLITSDGTYTYHAFKSTGSFIPAQSLTCDVLVVAGGGGAGEQTGGAGAGGLAYATGYSLTAGTSYAAVVGAGGAGGTGYGNNGANSSLSTITAIGGGGSAGRYNASPLSGGSGGSGAWGGGNGTSGGAATQTSGTGWTGYGNAGGASTSYNSIAKEGYGGGGGAGAVGQSGTSSLSGNGGNGISGNSSDAVYITALDAMGAATGTGQNVSGHYYYAGGGGALGGYSDFPSATVGGYGGGGAGSTSSTNTGGYGTAYTGGGAGGNGGAGQIGSAGGSGIVIVRYLS